jgi:hypothetical protein
MAKRGKTKTTKAFGRSRSRALRRRESGRPGGGAGRKDEVGRSGVYPASGPHPTGPAEIKTMAAWGQGQRGAAGYEDAGSSELVHTEPSTRAPRRKARPVRGVVRGKPRPFQKKAPLLLPSPKRAD